MYKKSPVSDDNFVQMTSHLSAGSQRSDFLAPAFPSFPTCAQQRTPQLLIYCSSLLKTVSTYLYPWQIYFIILSSGCDASPAKFPIYLFKNTPAEYLPWVRHYRHSPPAQRGERLAMGMEDWWADPGNTVRPWPWHRQAERRQPNSSWTLCSGKAFWRRRWSSDVLKQKLTIKYMKISCGWHFRMMMRLKGWPRSKSLN